MNTIIIIININHIYAGYLQLYFWNKPFSYAIKCCRYSGITIFGTCNVISHDKNLAPYTNTTRSMCSAKCGCFV